MVHDLLTRQEHLSSLRVFVAVFVLFNSYTNCSTSCTGSTDPSGTSEFTTDFILLGSCCLTALRITPLVVQELLALQEHLSFTTGFCCWVRVV